MKHVDIIITLNVKKMLSEDAEFTYCIKINNMWISLKKIVNFNLGATCTNGDQ